MSEPAPYADVAEHLRDELRRAWLRVEYKIRASWSRGDKSEGDADIDYRWTPDMIGKLLKAADDAYHRRVPSADSGAGTAYERWRRFDLEVDARIQATIEARRILPLLHLASAFRLTATQWSTLTFALMPELDPDLVLAYRYLARDSSCRGLDGRLLAQLVYDTPESRSVLARDLSQASPLIFFRLLDVQGTGGQNDSLLFRRVQPSARLVQLVDGARLRLDPELAEICELRGDPTGGMFPSAAMARAGTALQSGEVTLVLQGQRGLGKRLLLQLAAGESGRGVLFLDARRLSSLPAWQQTAMLRGVMREARLLGAVIAIPDIDDVLAQDGELPAFATQLLDEWHEPVAFTVARERLPRAGKRPLVHIELAVPPSEIRAAMWRDHVPSLDDAAADELADRFAVPGGIIEAAARAATVSHVADDGELGVSGLSSAVAGQLHQRIQRLGKRLPAQHSFEDLVLDDDTRSAILEIEAAVKERRTVREQWGMRGAHGLSVLFSGHPGVGKTMSGTVLARRLGLDIYEIDLSQVMSKWLGETEKNLAELFDAAEPGHVVLLFNEADSLFGKRTSDVKSSNDRYANLETNYLLQRLERFGGLAILTTNLAGAIDPAFKRRFSYDVYFSFPSVEMRAELWRRTLPTAARSADIDFEKLAETFELSGGFIKVACERAAYLAAAASSKIDAALLRRTVERMYRERGKLAAVGPLD